MTSIQAYLCKEKYYKEEMKGKEGKKAPKLIQKVREASIDVHLKKIKHSKLNKLIEWKKFKKIVKKNH
jgi:hypothetical protein